MRCRRKVEEEEEGGGRVERGRMEGPRAVRSIGVGHITKIRLHINEFWQCRDKKKRCCRQ